jgi:hypothetical protein
MDYASETFNTKLEQYLNSFEGDFDNFTLNNTGKKEYTDVKNFIFFNKKWVIDNVEKYTILYFLTTILTV